MKRMLSVALISGVAMAYGVIGDVNVPQNPVNVPQLNSIGINQMNDVQGLTPKNTQGLNAYEKRAEQYIGVRSEKQDKAEEKKERLQAEIEVQKATAQSYSINSMNEAEGYRGQAERVASEQEKKPTNLLDYFKNLFN
jgi:hypothetical protein